MRIEIPFHQRFIIAIAGGSKIATTRSRRYGKITTCVQQHRWNTFDAAFKDTDYVSSSIHTGLVSPIYKKLDADFQTTGGYGAGGSVCFAADQGSLWAGADVLLSEAGSKETTKDIHDAYEAKKEDIEEWMKDFNPLLEKLHRGRDRGDRR